MWKPWVNFILGLWLLLTGIIFASLFNWIVAIIIGVVVAVLAFWAGKWQGIVVGIVGIWTIVSGLWAGVQVPINFILIGAVVVILSLLYVLLKPKAAPAEQKE